MMSQQPDKLFRDKLSDFRKPLSTNAWMRVEQQLDKKTNKATWLKIAAAVLLVVASTFVIISSRDLINAESAKQISERNKEISRNKNGESAKEAIPNQNFPAVDSVKIGEKETKQETVTAPRNHKKETVKQPIKPSKKVTNLNNGHAFEHPPLAETKMVKEDSAVIMEIPEDISTNALANNSETNTAQGLKLVYNAGDVNEKYLDKKSLADATDEKKKESTLKKVLDKAYDLKNNQDPIGNLRQMKNEILAMNFKSEKQRNQNR
ncbi:MAG TPA: hypothetical protein VD927_10670 [Chryseosolibacter sp.]|nr:hypothetical protein [Chryseosolibacter sp.]